MGIKAEKAIIASKHTTVITTFTWPIILPGLGDLAIYVDIPLVDQHRELEVNERLKDLINRAREEGYRRPSVGTCYWYMPFKGSRADITFTDNPLDILSGDVAIGMAGDVRGDGRGSVILDSCWKEIMDWTNEQGRLTA